MKARIDVKPEEYEDGEFVTKRGLFGSKEVWVPAGKRTHYGVYLYLEASEEEKTVIKLNKLDLVEIDSEPVDTSHAEAELAATKDPTLRGIKQNVIDLMRARPTTYTLAHFMQTPCKRFFPTTVLANQYAAKLKSKILPKIKDLFAANSDVGPTSESFDL